MRSTATTSSLSTGKRLRRRASPRALRIGHSAARPCAGGEEISQDGRTLVRYRDWRGCSREVVTIPGRAESTLVLDRDARTHRDRRVLAHLAADEPPENALLVSRCFVRRAERMRCSCRRFRDADLQIVPFAAATPNAAMGQAHDLRDGQGFGYRLASLPGPTRIRELRWCRYTPGSHSEDQQPLSLRETVAALERYEPVLTLTRRALIESEAQGTVSVVAVRAEFARLLDSPIVLNRALRVAAVAAMERQGVSMSEIAMRCGHIKHDSAGNASGETSWLARRLGLLAEGGRRAPTPWIHSDVLALIARDGLGLSPREVEAD